ncbi:venom serine carboxypeptidase [Toxorhynchites rutilus septentrionalis]|uniref:venom serine carboxypeptidase n=1 Tax=Toxorhynchites rutilus septentrionalis TaxID=329112 RepID=UPI0024799CFE|nr:venom serine carboxypeptidase [Toxorhynchites rutilus septentrionalis]
MRPIVCVLLAAVTIFANAANGRLFINPYPRYEGTYRALTSDDDVGEPLFLTPFVKNGTVDAGRQAAKVNHSSIPADVESYSGYLTVDETFNSNLFFWYFVAKSDAQNDAPVVLWLQGGPGASSLYGLFTENGPFSVDSDKKLQPRKYSWHLNHHLIYIDNPVGTGFSFTDNEHGYSTDEKQVGNNLYQALVQFFALFPNLQSRKFYVTGESYGGKYVPAVSHKIHQMNGNTKLKINLQGLAIGNGLCDPFHQLVYGDYLYQIGLIDSNALVQFQAYEKKGRDCITKRDFNCAFQAFDELINGDQFSSGSLFKNVSGFETYFNYLETKPEAADDNMVHFLQLPETRRAIHVGKNAFHDLDKENKVEQHLKLDVMDSVAPYLNSLLNKYRVLIYNGQLDIIVAYPLTVNYVRKLNHPGAKTYKTAPRYIWKVNGDIAGYAKEAGNLVEVFVRNAGHMVPKDQPKWALDMIMRLTHGKGFSPKGLKKVCAN